MKELAMHQVLGMPTWVWVLVIGLLAINDAIKAAKWTRAESFVEALAMSLLRIPVLGTVILARFPVIGWLLRKLAGLEPPTEKPVAKAQGVDPPPPIRSGEGGFALPEFLGAAVLSAMLGLGLLLIFGAGAGGCANPMQGFKSGLTATAVTVSVGYRAADEYDAQKQPTLMSSAAFAAYKQARGIAMKSLATGADAVRSGNAALQAVDAKKRKDWPELTAKIIAAGLQIVDALKQWGVAIPVGVN